MLILKLGILVLAFTFLLPVLHSFGIKRFRALGEERGKSKTILQPDEAVGGDEVFDLVHVAGFVEMN